MDLIVSRAGTQSYGGPHEKRSLFCHFAGCEERRKGSWEEKDNDEEMKLMEAGKFTRQLFEGCSILLISGQLMATQPRPNFTNCTV